jgi:hypothetical protein
MDDNVKLSVVDPLCDPEWNQKLLDCKGSTIFHSANWAHLLASSYRYQPRYLVISDCLGFRGCMPVAEVSSIFTGKRGVSLSFADYCPAIVRNSSDFQILFEKVLEVGRKSRWKYVEFRGEPFLSDQLPMKVYVHHQIELSEDEGQMKSRLRDNTARNIRKAQKEGIRIEISQSLQAVHQFYHLHCLTRKRHGVPPQPRFFFENLHQCIISNGFGFTALAKYGESTVAALICLSFGSNAVYKYGASNMDFQHLRANNLLVWESIRMSARQGCRSFSLGRTDLENEGLLKFKNGWGAISNEINYYRYSYCHKGFTSKCNVEEFRYKSILKGLPVPVLCVLGRVAYRHIG